MRVFDVFGAALSLLSSQAVFQPIPDVRNSQILTAEVDAFINNLLSEWNTAGGAAVAVVRLNADGVWQVETKGYGYANTNGTKVTEQTLFAIGSNSKLFTTLAIGQLIANQSLSPQISWNTKIKDIVPEFELMDPIASNGTSIIDAMSHRTGLPRHDLMYGPEDLPIEVIKRLKYLRPSMEFREGFQYTNTMYTLLSYLPTALLPSQPTISDYVKTNILEPLGMDSTTYSYDAAIRIGNLAEGVARERKNGSEDPLDRGIPHGLPYWSQANIEKGNVISGPGGVISNAVDMAKWLQTLLLKGKNPRTNASVIPVDAINMVANGITVFAGSAWRPEFSPIVYGGGQWQSTYQGHVVIEHTGGTPGFLTSIARLPFDNLGVAVLTNDGDFGDFYMQAIKHRIIDTALGLPLFDHNSILKDQVRNKPKNVGTPRPPSASLPSRSISSLAGIYQNPGYGRVELCEVPTEGVLIDNQSATCKTLVESIPVVLPGAVDPKIPSLIARWNRAWIQYYKFAHFDQNVFNLTGWTSIPTRHETEPVWAANADESGIVLAEFAFDRDNIGFGITGNMWGAGEGVKSPIGDTVRERAEVWFEKV